MATLLESLNASKKAYSNLKENLQSAVGKLTSSKIFLEVSAENITESFQIDDLNADGKDIESQKDKIINNINLINNTIIPAIDTEISGISSKITKEEARIEEERRQAEERAAQEAEEARRREQEAANHNSNNQSSSSNENTNQSSSDNNTSNASSSSSSSNTSTTNTSSNQSVKKNIVSKKSGFTNIKM